MKVELQQLVCEYDGHTWTRTPQRGRVPKRCPDHHPKTDPGDTYADEFPGQLNLVDTAIIEQFDQTERPLTIRLNKREVAFLRRKLTGDSTPEAQSILMELC